MEGYLWGGGGENGRKGTRNKKYNWQVQQNRQEMVKNSIGNGEFK